MCPCINLLMIFFQGRNPVEFSPLLALERGQSSSPLEGEVRWGGVPKTPNGHGARTVLLLLPLFYRRRGIAERPPT